MTFLQCLRDQWNILLPIIGVSAIGVVIGTLIAKFFHITPWANLFQLTEASYLLMLLLFWLTYLFSGAYINFKFQK